MNTNIKLLSKYQLALPQFSIIIYVISCYGFNDANIRICLFAAFDSFLYDSSGS